MQLSWLVALSHIDGRPPHLVARTRWLSTSVPTSNAPNLFRHKNPSPKTLVLHFVNGRSISLHPPPNSFEHPSSLRNVLPTSNVRTPYNLYSYELIMAVKSGQEAVNLLIPKQPSPGVQPPTGLRPLCRKKMAFWSAGPKCGNYFHAAKSGRRCDQLTLSIPDLCPCSILQSRSFELPYEYFFTTQVDRGSSPVDVRPKIPENLLCPKKNLLHPKT